MDHDDHEPRRDAVSQRISEFTVMATAAAILNHVYYTSKTVGASLLFVNLFIFSLWLYIMHHGVIMSFLFFSFLFFSL